MTIKRVAPKTVTDTLAEAMEQADRFKHVLIIAETVEGDELSQMLFANEEITLAQLHYLASIVQQWALTVARNDAEGKEPPDPEENP